ncbi:MAG TPA: flagellar biosynthesis anti-sigma factor FlgM [Caldimonas sp.]|jgi:negative regulator of flagellin synthesis FlgM|nr:flagellar biosynthesis anti-sigma factor FlgM [Caldimonas sp.]HEX2539845.1 flagellar biosynthesis anti-sigma factor FlgM [Caldimonas sp.]
MKIGHPADKPPPPTGAASAAAAAEAAKPAAAAQAGAGAPSDPSAKVELSSTATGLLSGGTSAEFDANKVARMAESIANGTFKINADAIADKLIANAQELLTKVKG